MTPPGAARYRLRAPGEVLDVDVRVLRPLLGELILGEAGVDRAGLDAGVAVDALLGVDVQHLDLVVVRLVRRRVDAVDGADLDAGVVLLPDAGLGDHVGHGRATLPGVPITPRLWGERGRRRAEKLGIDP